MVGITFPVIPPPSPLPRKRGRGRGEGEIKIELVALQKCDMMLAFYFLLMEAEN
jgi:hypothetical protein